MGRGWDGDKTGMRPDGWMDPAYGSHLHAAEESSPAQLIHQRNQLQPHAVSRVLRLLITPILHPWLRDGSEIIL